jgi:hypothetical protein
MLFFFELILSTVLVHYMYVLYEYYSSVCTRVRSTRNRILE